MATGTDVEVRRAVRASRRAPRTSGSLRLQRVGFAILRPFLIFIPVFVFGTFITFLLGTLSGLNPAYVQLGDAATPAAVARLNHQYGLDRPFIVQYWSWFTDLLHGSLGVSWTDGVPISTMIGQRIGISLSVAIVALIIGVVFGAAFGTLAAVFRTSWIDRVITGITSLMSALPPFTVGIVLVAVFAVQLHALPSAGYVSLSSGFGVWFSHVILPATALSLDMVAGVARQLRAGLVSASGQNYVIGALVHGLSPRRIFFVHQLRNGGGPALALVGLNFPTLLGGAVVTESIFGLSGYGVFASTSALHGDVPAVQGVLVVSIVIVVGFNLLINIALNRIDPAAKRGV
ncbi:ABC transporter permease [Frondihabitans australicus]|uniref:Peptide/nickel transport system permease protein n=1 Tax=Frondihabitans australicus TaxID=386892 RepID=A0A495IIR5_9MICO|nr:ABC transporter permease [Frondihabitans australicus]RKR75201.1 peptide/nickel transport system permease protein [Frondihabitans australicus]